MELHDSVAAWLASLGTLPREAYTASRRPGTVKLDATHTARFESGMVRARGAGPRHGAERRRGRSPHQ